MFKTNKITVIWATILLHFTAMAQEKFDIKQYVNYDTYQKENIKLGFASGNERRVVFMGNSITEAWQDMRPEFFKENGYINRGISGQVTHQMLLRFRADVIGLNPKVVVILAGTNDIAQNSGYVTVEEIAQNIFSMAELADYHGIKVILCSVLPAIAYPWRPGVEPAPQIRKLNEILKHYSAEHRFVYVDYYEKMSDEEGGLMVPDYTSAEDRVHPNKQGYAVMEGLVQTAIDRALTKE